MRNHVLAAVCAAVCLIITASSDAQSVPPHRLVDAPTAGTLPSRSYRLETLMFDDGGFIQSVALGATDLLTVGCSYGGTGIIGAGRVTWQPHIGFQARVRIIEESMYAPGVAVGFDSQGYGPWAPGEKLNRFRTKSRGAYIVVSRNYDMLGDLGIHGGMNVSLENDDGDEDPSFWAGIDKNILNIVELAAEYDFATNDNEDDSMTAKRGYLNGAVRWCFGMNFVLEINVKNILRNTKRDIAGVVDDKPEPSREVRFTYRSSF